MVACGHAPETQHNHRPSNGDGVPPECASHIYYEVAEDRRRRGYGTRALALAKIEAAKLGMSEIVVCCHQWNEASRRIIERNGGVFELSAMTDDGDTMLKFRISLSV